jgi:hypothetical protein
MVRRPDDRRMTMAMVSAVLVAAVAPKPAHLSIAQCPNPPRAHRHATYEDSRKAAAIALPMALADI